MTPTGSQDARSLPAVARAFATVRHAGQRRRIGDRPFIEHPTEVAEILAIFYPGERELVAAGYLHDVVEKTNTTIEELTATFGGRVARLVDAVTKRPGEPWVLDPAGEPDVLRLKAADVLSNLHAVRKLVSERGMAAWTAAGIDPADKLAAWTRVIERVGAGLGDEPIVGVLITELGLLREGGPAAAQAPDPR